MAIHEYKCHGCGRVFEKVESMDAPDTTRHENCDGGIPGDYSFHGIGTRVPSVASIKFVGPGFYKNDYKDK